MKFIAHIKVMPNKELLDPQGKTVLKNLKNIDVTQVMDVRIGKLVELHIEADNEAAAEGQVKQACDTMLANPIMEYYTFDLKAL